MIAVDELREVNAMAWELLDSLEEKPGPRADQTVLMIDFRQSQTHQRSAPSRARDQPSPISRNMRPKSTLLEGAPPLPELPPATAAGGGAVTAPGTATPTPALDLDSVFGGGPGLRPDLYVANADGLSRATE